MIKTEKQKNLSFIALVMSLFYWLPACLILTEIFTSSGSLFPDWLRHILIPGYIIGFGLGYGGGEGGAFIGQLITLILLF